MSLLHRPKFTHVSDRVTLAPAGVAVDLSESDGSVWWLYDDKCPGQVERYDWLHSSPVRVVQWQDVPSDVRELIVREG